MKKFFDKLAPTYVEIHRAAEAIGRLITKNHPETQAILGVSRGGLIPAVVVSHVTKLPLVPISYSSQLGKGEFKGYDNTLPLLEQYQHIVIVDDLVDSGHTMKEMVEFYQPIKTQVITAVVFYKQREQIIHKPTIYWDVLDEDSGWINFPYE